VATTSETIQRDKLFVGGEWIDPAGDGTIEVVNPSTEEVIGTIPEGTSADVDRAAAAAQSTGGAPGVNGRATNEQQADDQEYQQQ